MRAGMLGRLRGEARAWREAWRGRHDNPVLNYLLCERRRAASRRHADAGYWAFIVLIFITCVAMGYQLLRLDIFFSSISRTSIATHAFALSMLLAATRIVCGGATVLLLLLVIVRLAQGLLTCSTLLATFKQRSGELLREVAATTLSDYEFVVAAVAFALRLVARPLLALVLLSSLNGLLSLLAERGGTEALAAARWPGGALWWLIGVSLVMTGIKLGSGLLAVSATALLLVSFSHVWRGPAVAAVVSIIAVGWMLAGLQELWLLGVTEYLPDWDALAWAMRPAWAVLLLAAGLLVLAIEAYAWDQDALYRWQERLGTPALRAILVTGGLAALFLGVGSFFPLEDLQNELNGMQSAFPSVGAWLASLTWPMQAVTFCPPLNLANLVGALDEPGAWLLVRTLGIRSLEVLLIPLALSLIYLSHARAAVFARRRSS